MRVRTFLGLLLCLLMAIPNVSCGKVGAVGDKSLSDSTAEDVVAVGQSLPAAIPVLPGLLDAPTARTPDTIVLIVEIDSYTIISHTIISELGDLKQLMLVDSLSDGKVTYLKVSPAPQERYEFAYIGSLPRLENGIVEITLHKVATSNLDIRVYPPNQITILLSVQDGVIKQNKFEDPFHAKLLLSLDKIRQVRGKKVASLKSELFDKETWDFPLPENDGDFRIVATRVIRNGHGDNENLFSIFGNWCGPGVPPSGRQGEPPAVTLLDKLCKNHDLCYEKVGEDNEEIARCDRDFAKEIRNSIFRFSESEVQAYLALRRYYNLSSYLIKED